MLTRSQCVPLRMARSSPAPIRTDLVHTLAARWQPLPARAADRSRGQTHRRRAGAHPARATPVRNGGVLDSPPHESHPLNVWSLREIQADSSRLVVHCKHSLDTHDAPHKQSEVADALSSMGQTNSDRSQSWALRSQELSRHRVPARAETDSRPAKGRS